MAGGTAPARTPHLYPDPCYRIPIVPRRTDIKTILLIGSGPIVIGQACEFDYSGTQAARALRAEGYRVVLVNSNPATIMTDPITADAVYLQALTPASIREIVEKEPIDAVLPTMGGQTALNLALALHDEGFWDERGIDVIGVDYAAVHITEDRQKFRDLMERIGLDQARSRVANSLLEAKEIAQELAGGAEGRDGGTGSHPFQPVVLRPSASRWAAPAAASSGGAEDFDADGHARAPALARPRGPRRGVPLRVEGVRARAAPRRRRQRRHHLLDRERRPDGRPHRRQRDGRAAADAHGPAVPGHARRGHPRDAQHRDVRGRLQHPVRRRPGHGPDGRDRDQPARLALARPSPPRRRATRSPRSPPASPSGYTLDELPNEVTGTTSACFEPSIDYVVTKVPRFNFDKFEGVDEALTTQMKAVGEVMAIGRTFAESLQKAFQSLEQGFSGLGADGPLPDRSVVRARLAKPYWDRLLHVRNAFRLGTSVEEVADVTRVDPWFLHHIHDMVELEREVEAAGGELPRALLLRAKQAGFSDVQLAYLTGSDEAAIRARREALGLRPTFRVVDTCAGEFRGRHALLLLDLRRRGRPGRRPRVRRVRPREGAHPRLGPEPHRAGHRVRLQLRPRRARGQGDGLRGRPDQLQPGDRLDRLRRRRQALLRARLLGARPRRDRAREAGRRDGAARRADGAEARPQPARNGHPALRDALREHGPRRGPRQVLAAARGTRDPVPALRHRAHGRGGRGRARGHRLPGPGAPELRARRAGHAHRHQPRRGRGLRRGRAAHVPRQRGPAGPLPRGRHRGRHRRALRRRPRCTSRA